MTDRYDPLPDLAGLVRASLRYGRDCAAYAERVAGALGIGEDDSPAEVEARLREALRLAEWRPGDPCLIVQHDPATRLPLEGGGTYRGTVESVAGTRALIRLEIGMVLSADGGWVTEPSGALWRLMRFPASAPGPYKVEGKDGFDPDADYYPLSEHPDYGEALRAARDRLAELNQSQPGAGGQDGIQDRVYVLHPDGRRERVFS